MKRITFLLFTFTSLLPSSAQELRSDINLSDPFVMADAKTKQYYMTGTGGGLWKSSDLQVWTYLGFPLQFNAWQFAESGTSGISSMRGTSNDKGMFHSLNGQRVKHPSKGIYIRNGKKVIL